MFPSARTILAETAHRPYALPQRAWVIGQSWRQLLFAHWRVEPSALAPLIPAGLELDTFDGSAWIGVVPFLMHDVHLRATYPALRLPPFPELNVRTYVQRDGRRGVWFLSLDAGNSLAVRAARRFFHLPYYKAEMQLFTETDWVRYRSRRAASHAPAADFEGCYRPTTPVFRAERGSLDEWLIERYCLYSADARGQLYRCDIQHRQWPLQRAEAQITVNTMVELPPDPPILHYADRLDVLTWPLERL